MTENWAGPGNEAKSDPLLQELGLAHETLLDEEMYQNRVETEKLASTLCRLLSLHFFGVFVAVVNLDTWLTVVEITYYEYL